MLKCVYRVWHTHNMSHAEHWILLFYDIISRAFINLENSISDLVCIQYRNNESSSTDSHKFCIFNIQRNWFGICIAIVEMSHSIITQIHRINHVKANGAIRASHSIYFRLSMNATE